MIAVRRRIYDPEKQRVFVEIVAELPGGGEIMLRESGGVFSIARRLAAKFALPAKPKDLAEELSAQIEVAPFEVLGDAEENDEEENPYFAFHCWLTERGGLLLKEQKLWFVPLETGGYAARFTEEACRDFLRYAGIPESDRRSLFRHWREKGWLRTNNAKHFKKRARVVHAGAPCGFIQFYEVSLSEGFQTDETLGADGLPLGVEPKTLTATVG